MFPGLVTLLRRTDRRGAAAPNFVVCLCRHLFIIVILCPVLSPFGPSLAFSRFSEPFRTSKTFFSTLCHESKTIRTCLPSIASAKEGPTLTDTIWGYQERLRSLNFFQPMKA